MEEEASQIIKNRMKLINTNTNNNVPSSQSQQQINFEEIEYLNRLQRTFSEKMRKRIQHDFYLPDKRIGLDLGSLADNIISYMPINYSGTIDILDKGLTEVTGRSWFRTYTHGIHWNKEVLAYLATPRFTKYKSKATDSKTTENHCVKDFHKVRELWTAQYNLLNSKENEEKIINTDGTIQSASTSMNAQLTEYKLALNALLTEETHVCQESCGMPRTCLNEFGGRGLLTQMESSPILKIIKLLRTILPKYPTLKELEATAATGSRIYINNCTKQDIVSKNCIYPDDNEVFELQTSPYDIKVNMDIKVNCQSVIRDGICTLKGAALEIFRCLEEIPKPKTHTNKETNHVPIYQDIPSNEYCHTIYLGNIS